MPVVISKVGSAYVCRTWICKIGTCHYSAYCKWLNIYICIFCILLIIVLHILLAASGRRPWRLSCQSPWRCRGPGHAGDVAESNRRFFEWLGLSDAAVAVTVTRMPGWCRLGCWCHYTVTARDPGPVVTVTASPVDSDVAQAVDSPAAADSDIKVKVNFDSDSDSDMRSASEAGP
jgi:hypothetical protein